MSSLGYFVHIVDMNLWLTMAQKALVTKNKVRKELWAELVGSIQWNPIDSSERMDYFRISQTAFVAIQTFCLTDGKGSDTLSSDQLLNWCTTLADLRARVPAVNPSERLQASRVSAPLASLVEEHKAAEEAAAVLQSDEEEEVVHS